MLGRLADALDHYRKSLALDPENSLARYGFGNALLTSGDTQSAIQELKQAVADGLEVPLAYIKLGIALRSQGDAGESVEAFRMALEMLDEEQESDRDTLESRYEQIVAELGAGNPAIAQENAEMLIGEEADPTAISELMEDLRRLAELNVAGAEKILKLFGQQAEELIN
jgi:tetratricopeptide (TPR) repeat protein